MGNKSIISSLGLGLVFFFFDDNNFFFSAQNLPLYRDFYKKYCMLSFSLHVKSQTNFIHLPPEQKQAKIIIITMAKRLTCAYNYKYNEKWQAE